MRTRMVATLVLALALTAAGCSHADGDGSKIATAQSGDVTPKSSASAAVDDHQAALNYAKCMRDHGMTWFADPKDGGKGLELNAPPGTDQTKLDAAQDTCKSLMPGGGPQKHQPLPEELEKLRQLASCMRANGIPKFPDPNADGGIEIDPKKIGTGPDDPTWKKAEAACSQYQPKKGETHQQGPDGGAAPGKTA